MLLSQLLVFFLVLQRNSLRVRVDDLTDLVLVESNAHGITFVQLDGWTLLQAVDVDLLSIQDYDPGYDALEDQGQVLTLVD